MNEYKVVDGLVWRRYNNSIFGVNPDDDEIVQKSYNLKHIQGDWGEVICSQFEKGGTTSEESVKQGDRETLLSYLNELGDKLIDSKIHCFGSFTI